MIEHADPIRKARRFRRDLRILLATIAVALVEQNPLFSSIILGVVGIVVAIMLRYLTSEIRQFERGTIAKSVPSPSDVTTP